MIIENKKAETTHVTQGNAPCLAVMDVSAINNNKKSQFGCDSRLVFRVIEDSD